MRPISKQLQRALLRSSIVLLAATAAVLPYSNDAQAATLTWDATTPASWNTSALNFTGTAWSDFNDAVFGNTGVGTITIVAGGVTPLSTTLGNTTGNFNFLGGSILGGTLVANGAGGTRVFDNTSNAFSSVSLSSGTLEFIDRSFTGSSSIMGTGTVSLSGGTLNLRTGGSTGGTAGNSTAQTVTFGNNVVVTGNTTINIGRQSTASSAQNKTIQLNNLTIGTNTLTSQLLSGSTGYALLFNGTTTLTGNPTFGVTSGPLTLGGSINQGSTAATPFSFTKDNSNTLTLSSNTQTFTGGITISNGSLTAISNSKGNNPIFIAGGATLNNTNGGTAVTYVREISGGGILRNTATGTVLMNIFPLHNAEFSGTATNNAPALGYYGPATWKVTSGIFGSQPAAAQQSVIGNGELRLSDAGTFGGNATNGTIIATGGMITLDNTATNNSNRLTTPGTFTMQGGTIRLLGSTTAATDEVVAAVGFGLATASTIDVQAGAGQTASFSGTTLTRTNATFLNIKYSGSASVFFATNPATTNNVLAGIFVNGNNFATHTGNGNPINAFTAYTNPIDINSPGATNTVLVDGTTTTTTLTAARTFNALKIDGAKTITMGTNALNLGTNVGGTTELPAMILKTGAGSATISGTGAITNTGVTVSPEISFRVNEGELTVTAPLNISGSAVGGMNKLGQGLLILDPSAAWSTGSQVPRIRAIEGAIRMDPTNTRFNGTLRVINGGVFELLADWNPALGNAAGELTISPEGGGFAASGANRTFARGITFGVTTTGIGDGKALLLNSTTADSTIIMSGAMSLGATANQMWFREIRVADNPNSTTDGARISGQITATGNQLHLFKTGPGQLELTNNTNSYAGQTIVREGTLLIGANAPQNSDGALGNSDSFVVVGESDGNLTSALLTNGAFTIGRRILVQAGSSGTTTLGGNAAASSTFSNLVTLRKNATLAQVANGNTTFSGVIGEDGGSFGLTKADAGSVTLTNSNTYTGGTIVNAGTLVVNNTIGSGTGTAAVLVNSSGTLAGNGFISGAVNISGGTLAPGNSIDSLDTGTLSFTGGTFAAEINTSALTADLVNVTGDLNLTSNPTLMLTDIGSDVTLSPGTVFKLITYSGSWNSNTFLGHADDSTFTFGANSYKIDYNEPVFGGSAVTLTAIPEPGTLALVGLGAVGFFRLRIRRRRAK